MSLFTWLFENKTKYKYIPIKSTKKLNELLNKGWSVSSYQPFKKLIQLYK